MQSRPEQAACGGRLQRWLCFAAAGAVALGIFCFSAQTGEQSGGISDRIAAFLCTGLGLPLDVMGHFVRKTAHFMIYFLLGLSLGGALGTWPWGAGRRLALGTVLCALYAASDELHQSFVAGRGPSPADVLLDSCGAAVGGLLACGLCAARRRARQ